jgi:hypothetical protein
MFSRIFSVLEICEASLFFLRRQRRFFFTTTVRTDGYCKGVDCEHQLAQIMTGGKIPEELMGAETELTCPIKCNKISQK